MELKHRIKYILSTLVLILFIFSTSPSLAQSPTSSPSATEENSLLESLSSIASTVITLNNPAQLDKPRSGFGPGEKPEFNLDIPIKTESEVGKTKISTWKTSDEEIAAVITEKETGATVSAVIKKNAAGDFEILAEKGPDWEPGNYTLQVSAKESFVYTRDLTQDFSWGVLSVNTNKASYLPGETAKLSFGILNELGHTLCDAPLSVRIVDPEGNEQVLSRENGKIRQSGECAGDSITEKPDYLADYQTAGVGTYLMVLTGTNKNGTHTISDYFTVEQSLPYEIERTKFPTRVYPMSPYDVELTIKVNQDYQGEVRDFVPKAFYIENISNNGIISQSEPETATMSAEVLATDAEAYSNIPELSKLMYDSKTLAGTALDKTPNPITWNVDWKAGHTYTLSYSINFPTVSPEFFLIGPFTVSSEGNASYFYEQRQWQVANDAARTWDGGGADNNWSTANNWSSNLVAGSGDTATFNSTSTKNATIDSSITIQRIAIATGYTGTLTQSGSFTVTINTGGTNLGFTIADGAFVGGSGDITMTASGGDFVQSGGTFTSTSGKFLISDNFTVSAGTWNNGSGTVGWTDAGDDAYTISANGVTFYNFSTVDTCAGTITFTNGHTYTVSNQLNFGNNCGSSTLGPSFAGTATINVTGNVNVTQNGNSGGGAAVFLVNGTGSQTIDGETDEDSRLPDMTFNKSSGTLTFTDTVVFDDNVTFTAASGGLTTTGSKMLFNASDDAATITLSGTWNLNAVEFGEGSNTHTLSTGTMVVNDTLTFENPSGGGGTDQLNCSSGGAIQAKGNIALIGEGISTGSCVLTVDGTGTQTLTSENDDDTVMLSMTVNKSSGTFDIVDDVIIDGETWTLTSGTLDTFNGYIYLYDATLSGDWTVNDLAVDGNGFSGSTIDTGSDVNVLGTLQLGGSNNNTRLFGDGTLHAKGNVNAVFGGLVTQFGDASLVVIDGTGSQTLDGEADDDTYIPNLTINKTSGTLTLTDTIVQNGDIIHISGTMSPGTSTLRIATAGTLTGTPSFGNVYICLTQFETFTLDTGAVLTATGNVDFSDTGCGAGNNVFLDGPGTIAVQGNITTGEIGIQGDANVSLTGTGSQSININVADAFPSGTFTINKASGTATLGQAFDLGSSGQDLLIQSGTFDIGNYNLTVSDQLTVQSTATVKLTGDQTITTGSTTSSGSVEYTGTGTYTSLKFGNTYYNLTISGAGTYSPSGTLTVNGTFTQSAGTFNMPSNMKLGGSLVRTSGTFTPGSNTLTLENADNTATIDGNITLYNLTVITPGKVIILGAGDTMTVTNALTMRSNTGNAIQLRSDSAGVQANFTVNQVSPSVVGVLAKDINSCSGNTINALNSGNQGNVTCWAFSAQNWYDTAWPERKRIRIFKEKVSGGPHTDFPVLISIVSDASISSLAQADGDDLLFTSGDGITKLDHEIENYTTGTGALTAWVSVPTVSSTEDTILYLYYGNSIATNQQSATDVWTDYIGVWHMNNDPSGTAPQVTDSTGKGHNGTSAGTMTSGDLVTGKIDRAIDLDGVNDRISTPDTTYLDDINTAITLEGWVYKNANQSGFAHTINRQVGTGGSEYYGLYYNTNTMSPSLTSSGGTGSVPNGSTDSTGSWIHYAMTWDGNTVTLYRNGTSVNTDTLSGTVGDDNQGLDFGANDNGVSSYSEYFNGRLDEYRITNIARSADWIATQYSNMNLPGEFASVDGSNQAIPRVNIQGGVYVRGGSKIKN